MAYLRIKEHADSRGVSLGQLQRDLNLPISTLRRYWWSSLSGLERDGGTLNCVKLPILKAIADYMGVRPGDLIGSVDVLPGRAGPGYDETEWWLDYDERAYSR